MGASWSQHYSYRPLTTLTFRWNVAFFGFDTFYFHLVNVLVHAIASGLSTYLTSLLCPEFGLTAALVSGLTFAVHPVHVEAVSNIVCRAELLSFVFWASALIVYIKGTKSLVRSSRPSAVFQFALILIVTATFTGWGLFVCFSLNIYICSCISYI